MLHSEDAIKMSEQYLNKEDGQLKEFDNFINSVASKGGTEFKVEWISEYAKEQLEAAGYKIYRDEAALNSCNVVISWGIRKEAAVGKKQEVAAEEKIPTEPVAPVLQTEAKKKNFFEKLFS